MQIKRRKFKSIVDDSSFISCDDVTRWVTWFLHLESYSLKGLHTVVVINGCTDEDANVKEGLTTLIYEWFHSDSEPH